MRVGDRHAQLRLADPVVAARGDRVVLRGGTTVGGGLVLDPAPPRRVDAERDRLLGEADPASIVRALVHAPVSVEQLAARALLSGAELEEGLDAVRVVDGWAFSDSWLEETAAEVEGRLRARAERSPLDPGLVLAEVMPAEPWASAVLDLLPVERRGAEGGAPGHGRIARCAQRRCRGARAGARRRRLGGDEGRRRRSRPVPRVGWRLVRLGDFAVGAGGYEVACDLVVTECAAAGEITLARFRDLAGVGRRDAQLLLERMDVDGITRRIGDRRVLRRSARAGA